MGRIKRFFSQLPLLILWLLFGVILWGFVFTRITDAPPARKLVVCVDGEVPGATALAQRLEAQAGPAIRMVKVRPFAYAMFDADTLVKADLFIVRAESAALYADWFRPLPEDMAAEDSLPIDGAPFGLPLNGAAAEYIDHGGADGWYLFFGARSLHAAGNENAVDDEASAAARLILSLH